MYSSIILPHKSFLKSEREIYLAFSLGDTNCLLDDCGVRALVRKTPAPGSFDSVRAWAVASSEDLLDSLAFGCGDGGKEVCGLLRRRYSDVDTLDFPLRLGSVVADNYRFKLVYQLGRGWSALRLNL